MSKVILIQTPSDIKRGSLNPCAMDDASFQEA
jgi:hypothetical protein